MSSSKAPHILVFPYPAQGHILALLDLTHNLALKGLTITIIITPKNLPILNPLLSTHPTTIHTLLLPFPSHPKLPPGVEHVRELGNTGNYPIINALSKLHNPIIQWYNSHPNPPVALISDFFLGSTHQLATQLGIPRLAFQSCAAFLAIVFDHLWRNAGTVLKSQKLVEFPGVPGTPSFRHDHLPSLFRRYRESDPDSEFVRESMVANMASWGYVINTSRALEGPYLDYLSTEMGHTRVFGVGPLGLIGIQGGFNRVDPNPDGGPGDVLRWLDESGDGSVLYVCFGSQKMLKREQMEALAFGLERSETRFVWVVKEALTKEHVEEGYGVVPGGFEDRVSGRGLVVRGWVPQVAILGHGAVGGFLSHCGWNSVLEAVAAGVVVIGWPMEADQFVNAKLLVDDMGVAVRVCEGADSVPDPDELGRVIAGSMSGDSSKKRRAKVMREEAARAVSEGGSSFKELDELVEALKQLGAKGG